MTITFSSPHDLIDAVRQLLQINHTDALLKGLTNAMADFATDLKALETEIAANTAAVAQFAAAVKTDTDTIASLQAQVAALKAAQPTLDLSQFEADITQLKTNNATIIAALPPINPLTPVDLSSAV